jgi:threonine dehydrogenase-like Zn-dependent dehydrogenase
MNKQIARAGVWVNPSSINIIELKIPQVKDDGMLIKINATSICGTDGQQYPTKPPGPVILGHEISGTIVEMGKDANLTIKSFSGPLAVGDRIALYPWITCGRCPNCMTYGNGACTVCDDSYHYGALHIPKGKGESKYGTSIYEFPYLTGGFAEYMYIYPGTYVWKVPTDMPDNIASLLDPLAVAVRIVELAQKAPGVLEDSFNLNSTVLVIGDGAIGVLTALVARIMGANKIIIAGGRDKRLATAKAISGADVTMNYKNLSLAQRKEIVDDMTHGYGADVVFQCVGSVQAFNDGIELMKKVGTLIEAGNVRNVAVTEFDVTKNLCRKHATLIGMMVNTPTAFNKAFTLLTRFKKYNLESIFSHRCTLVTLDATMKKMKDDDFLKGWVDFK